MKLKLVAIAALLLLGAGQANATWLEARTDHFIVYSEGNEQSLRLLASRLERFDKGLRKIHHLANLEDQRANPLTVYVVSNVADVQKLCAGGTKGGCKNVAGFYNGRVSGSIAYMPKTTWDEGEMALSAQIVLFHEYSHHIMLANYASAFPAWFVEGFAEFNSTAKFDRDGTVGFGLPALHRGYGLLRGVPLSAETMMKGNTAGFSAEKIDAFYGRGWLLTHYLTFERSRAGQLAKYIDLINAGKSSIDAARTVFGDLDQLDKDLNAYLRRKTMNYQAVVVPEVAADAIQLRRLTAGEQAMMSVRQRSDRGVNNETAPAIAMEARNIARAFPGDAGAQRVLAEAEYDAGYYDEAEAAADRALAVKPDDYGALIYKGQIAMRRAQRANASDDATWKRVRSWFVKANRVENNAAEALWLFYRSFLEQGEEPNANAVAGLRRAFELVPQDKMVRFTLARQYLRDGKFDDGRAALAALAFDPHAPPNNRAMILVGLIDKGDHAAVRAQIGGLPQEDGEED